MDFEHTEEERLFRDAVRDFVESEISPHAAKWEEEEHFPRDTWQQLAKLGVCGVAIPTEYGGGGGGKTLLCIATEELSRASAGLGTAYLVSCGIAMDGICKHGTEAQKKEYLSRCARGEMAFFALTEPGGGSDVALMQTRYRKTERGYSLSGTKTFISNGEESSFGVLFASRNPGAGHRGISAFVLNKNTPGFSSGKKEKKTGQHCSSTTELLMDDCVVPRESLLGREGHGTRIALEAIDKSRVAVAAQAIGIARAAYDESVRYAKERRAFGKALGQLQAIQWMIADMSTDLEAARLLTYSAASLIDQGNPAIRESAMAKLFATEAAGRICHKAVQIFGGYGYSRDTPVERFARDQRVTEIYEGTSEMQRWAIARQVLGMR
jgi:butyryl-CoA dehydrogenase